MAGIDIDAFYERFVAAYNQPESDVRQFYADELVWVELPGGRSGGRQDYFDALAGVRGNLTDLTMTKLLSTHAVGNVAVVENEWTAKVVADGSTLNSIQAWFWEFDDDGKIVRQHDYFMPVTGEPLGYE